MRNRPSTWRCALAALGVVVGGLACSPPPAGSDVPCRGACGANASCLELPDGDVCTCLPGFHHEGSACVNVDECASGLPVCGEAGRCEDTEGSFVCLCNSPTVSPLTCVAPLDLCDLGLDSCSPFARCFSLAGVPTCVCHPGFFGEGQTCDPSPDPSTSALPLLEIRRPAELSIEPEPGLVFNLDDLVSADPSRPSSCGFVDFEEGGDSALPALEVALAPYLGLTSSLRRLVSPSTLDASVPFSSAITFDLLGHATSFFFDPMLIRLTQGATSFVAVGAPVSFSQRPTFFVVEASFLSPVTFHVPLFVNGPVCGGNPCPEIDLELELHDARLHVFDDSLFPGRVVFLSAAVFVGDDGPAFTEHEPRALRARLRAALSAAGVDAAVADDIVTGFQSHQDLHLDSDLHIRACRVAEGRSDANAFSVGMRFSQP